MNRDKLGPCPGIGRTSRFSFACFVRIWVRILTFGCTMDLLQMDIHRRVNEFMHLSLSKVSQKHFRHAFPL